MTERTDAIIIGAGHNGLVCAAYLAQAGLNVVCLESAGSAGGMSAPRTIGEDYHFPGLAHTTYPVSQSMRKDLKLDRFGYAPGRAIDTIALDTDTALDTTPVDSSTRAFCRTSSSVSGTCSSVAACVFPNPSLSIRTSPCGCALSFR